MKEAQKEAERLKEKFRPFARQRLDSGVIAELKKRHGVDKLSFRTAMKDSQELFAEECAIACVEEIIKELQRPETITKVQRIWHWKEVLTILKKEG